MKFKLKYKPKSNTQTENHSDITKKDSEILLFPQGSPRDFFQKENKKNVTDIERRNEKKNQKEIHGEIKEENEK